MLFYLHVKTSQLFSIFIEIYNGKRLSSMQFYLHVKTSQLMSIFIESYNG